MRPFMHLRICGALFPLCIFDCTLQSIIYLSGPKTLLQTDLSPSVADVDRHLHNVIYVFLQIQVTKIYLNANEEC